MDKHSIPKNTNGRNLREWAEGKSPFFAYQAIGVVASCGQFHAMLKALHEADFSAQFSSNDAEEWLEACKHSRKMLKYILTTMANEHAPIAPLEFKPIKLLTRAAYSDNPKQIERLKKRMEKTSEDDRNNIIEDFIDHMTVELDNLINSLTTKQSASLDEQQEDYTVEAEAYFIFNNHMMCLIEYNECFTLLYRKARLGDYEAIKKLIRIDPILLKDKFINHHFATAKRSISSKLLAAYNNPLKYYDSVSKIKVSLCGLLSAHTEVFGGECGIITPNELRNLFDAFAIDVFHKPADEDLPIEHDAFRKAVKRHHKLWYPILSNAFGDPS